MSNEIVQQKQAAITPTTPMQLLQMAVEREGSIDVIERLAKLQTEMLDREARIAYIQAFEEFKSTAPTLVKDSEILVKGEGRGRYAKLDQVADKLIPALLAVGITHRWQTETMADGRISVTCFMRHRLGHEERGSNMAGPPDTSGSKNAVQAIGSTVSYFERYTLVASCGLAIKDADTDAAIKSSGMDDQQFIILHERIEGAATIDELRREYIAALKVAERAGDKSAAKQFEAAKDRRKAELL